MAQQLLDRVQRELAAHFEEASRVREQGLESRIEQAVQLLSAKILELESMRERLLQYLHVANAHSEQDAQELEDRVREMQEKIVAEVRAEQFAYQRALCENIKTCNLAILNGLADSMRNKFDEINFSVLNEPFQRLSEKLELELQEDFFVDTKNVLNDLNNVFNESLKEFLGLNNSMIAGKNGVNGNVNGSVQGNNDTSTNGDSLTTNSEKTAAIKDKKKEKQQAPASASQAQQPSGGMLNRFKSLFKAREKQEEGNYTAAHLGEDSSKMSYDKVKKKWVFEGEKEEEEPELGAPPTKRSATPAAEHSSQSSPSKARAQSSDSGLEDNDMLRPVAQTGLIAIRRKKELSKQQQPKALPANLLKPSMFVPAIPSKQSSVQKGQQNLDLDESGISLLNNVQDILEQMEFQTTRNQAYLSAELPL